MENQKSKFLIFKICWINDMNNEVEVISQSYDRNISLNIETESFRVNIWKYVIPIVISLLLFIIANHFGKNYIFLVKGSENAFFNKNGNAPFHFKFDKSNLVQSIVSLSLTFSRSFSNNFELKSIETRLFGTITFHFPNGSEKKSRVNLTFYSVFPLHSSISEPVLIFRDLPYFVEFIDFSGQINIGNHSSSCEIDHIHYTWSYFDSEIIKMYSFIEIILLPLSILLLIFFFSFISLNVNNWHSNQKYTLFLIIFLLIYCVPGFILGITQMRSISNRKSKNGNPPQSFNMIPKKEIQDNSNINFLFKNMENLYVSYVLFFILALLSSSFDYLNFPNFFTYIEFIFCFLSILIPGRLKYFYYIFYAIFLIYLYGQNLIHINDSESFKFIVYSISIIVYLMIECGGKIIQILFKNVSVLILKLATRFLFSFFMVLCNIPGIRFYQTFNKSTTSEQLFEYSDESTQQNE